jgi:hypothetical protein
MSICNGFVFDSNNTRRDDPPSSLHQDSPKVINKGSFIKLDYNSGGKVFFCLFKAPQGVLAAWEGILVIKFGPTRCDSLHARRGDDS